MAYTKQTWIDDAIGNTPLSADRLNYMEDGIEDAANTNPVPSGTTAGQVIVWNGSDWIAQDPPAVTLKWDGSSNYSPSYWRASAAPKRFVGPTDPTTCTGVSVNDYDTWENTT